MARIRADVPRPSSTRSQDTPGPDNRSDPLEAGIWRTCNIYNTTFSLYRASPLFVGLEGLSESRLNDLEARLRDILTGDSRRGIEFALDEGEERSMGNAGALEAVTIGWASVKEIEATPRPALQVTLQYENAECMAVLLPTPEVAGNTNEAAAEPGDAFISLPLLLLRMPTPLKDTMARFLSSAFDCRITPLHLSGRNIVHSWECWAHETALPTAGPLARDVVLTFAFNVPGLCDIAGVTNGHASDYSTDLAFPRSRSILTSTDSDDIDSTTMALKTLDVFISNADLGGFWKAGKQLDTALDDMNDTPFTGALSYYLKENLGLDISNPAVEVVRVACGGFVLSTNRIKIFDPPSSRLDSGIKGHRSSVPRVFGALVSRAIG